MDLARLAGLNPSAVIIEVVKENGEMARIPQLEKICAEHKLKMCSVEQIIEYRLEREGLVQRMEPFEGTKISTPEGEFNLIAFSSTIDPLPHLALTVGGVGDLDARGNVKPIDEPVLVRVHRRDLLGDIFNVTDNPTGDSLRASLRMIQKAGIGTLIYMRPEGYGDGLNHRLLRIKRSGAEDVNAPDLTRTDGVAARAQPMDNRDIGIGGQILHELGLSDLRILTNNPKTYTGLHGFGLQVVDQVAIDA